MNRIGRKPFRTRTALLGAGLLAVLGGAPSRADSLAPPPYQNAAAPSFPQPERAPDFGRLGLSPLVQSLAERPTASEATSIAAFKPRYGAELSPAIALSRIDPARFEIARFDLSQVDRDQVDRAETATIEPAAQKAPPPAANSKPDRTAAVVAAALDRLILRDDRANPLGAGDWRAARAAIGAFYAGRLFQPVWVDAEGLTPAGRSAVERLTLAADDGLALGPFAPPRAFPAPLSPDELANAEVAIAAAVVVYAGQASGSRVAPSRISPLISETPAVADPGAALAETVSAADPGQRLADFNPPQKAYRLLRDQLKRLSDPNARAVRRDVGATLSLLASNDDNAAVARIAGPRLKRLAGRQPSATPGEPPSGAHSRQRDEILANMEMWRWQSRDRGERRIEVNVPDFTVAVLDGDAVVHRARVVVGKPATPTPIFSNMMRYVVINPSWHVPQSIIKKEMMSKLDTLGSHGYEVKTVNGQITVRQVPGERNALGRLAFMFPNDFSVYLHDTPSRSLFDTDPRAYSHGCVRVEDPVRLAEIVLEWPEERITGAFGARERTVYLPRPLPIHIEYFTAFVDEYGNLRERPDLYGLTRRVADTLSSVRQD